MNWLIDTKFSLYPTRNLQEIDNNANGNCMFEAILDAAYYADSYEASDITHQHGVKPEDTGRLNADNYLKMLPPFQGSKYGTHIGKNRNAKDANIFRRRVVQHIEQEYIRTYTFNKHVTDSGITLQDVRDTKNTVVVKNIKNTAGYINTEGYKIEPNMELFKINGVDITDKDNANSCEEKINTLELQQQEFTLTFSKTKIKESYNRIKNLKEWCYTNDLNVVADFCKICIIVHTQSDGSWSTVTPDPRLEIDKCNNYIIIRNQGVYSTDYSSDAGYHWVALVNKGISSSINLPNPDPASLVKIINNKKRPLTGSPPPAPRPKPQPPVPRPSAPPPAKPSPSVPLSTTDNVRCIMMYMNAIDPTKK